MASDRMGLPVRPFLYTLDQIATLISTPMVTVKNNYLHYQGRSLGPRPPSKMLAINLSEDGEKPEWRVAEQEFIQWLRRKGYRVYDRSWK